MAGAARPLARVTAPAADPDKTWRRLIGMVFPSQRNYLLAISIAPGRWRSIEDAVKVPTACLPNAMPRRCLPRSSRGSASRLCGRQELADLFVQSRCGRAFRAQRRADDRHHALGEFPAGP